MKLPLHKLGTRVQELHGLSNGDEKVLHLPDWHKLSHDQRLVILRKIAQHRGRDPRIAKQAVKILREAGIRPRQYTKQAQALFKWVQDPRNVYYANESGERLQDPIYTLKHKMGDCDDLSLLLTSLFESIRFSWKLLLIGVDKTTHKKVRYVEGSGPLPPNVEWNHIYCAVGVPPFKPKRWYLCEPTVEEVPLGWDIIDGGKSFIPKHVLAEYNYGHVGLGSNPYGQVGTAVGASLAAEVEGHGLNWKQIGVAVLTGVTVSIATQLVLDWVRGAGIWKDSGPITHRIDKAFEHYRPLPRLKHK